VIFSAELESSASLLKVVAQLVGCCRDLEMIVFDDLRGRLILQRSDILAIASLPRLKCLKIYGGGGIAEDAYSALSRCRGLKKSLESRLNSLCKLKVNGESVHLGTDWEGYQE
jgi:hypothetical protein